MHETGRREIRRKLPLITRKGDRVEREGRKGMKRAALSSLAVTLGESLKRDIKAPNQPASVRDKSLGAPNSTKILIYTPSGLMVCLFQCRGHFVVGCEAHEE